MVTPLIDAISSFELLIEYLNLRNGGLLFENTVITSLIFAPILYLAYINRQLSFYLALFFLFGFHRKVMPFLPSFFSPKVAVLAVIWFVTFGSWKNVRWFYLKKSLSRIYLGDRIVFLFFSIFLLSSVNAYFLGQSTLANMIYPLFGLVVYSTFRFLIPSKKQYFSLLIGLVITLHVHLGYSIFFSDSSELRMDGVVGKNSSAFILCICLSYFMSFVSHKTQCQRVEGVRRLWEVIAILYFLLTGFVVFGLGSRSGFAIFAIALFFMILSHRVIFRVSAWGLLLVGLTLPLLLTQLDKKTFVAEKVIRTFVALVNFETPPDTSSLDRIAVWQTYLNTEIPFLGLGPGGFRRIIDPLASENFYIQTSAELGILGLTFLVTGLLLLLMVVTKSLIESYCNDNSAEFHFWLPSLVATLSLVFYGFFNDLLFQPYVWILWGVAFGVYYASVSIESETAR